MSSSALAAGLRHLRRQLAAQQPNNGSDEQLLHAFTSRRDDGAFAALMRRHGPMVLHVCRRVLGHEQDAEDAFQATFLVLARNAATLRPMSNVAGYLHGTAHRTAMKAKQSAARRRKYEGQAPARPPVDPADELSWREVRVLLDKEIARLPETYRSVFVLCCLEGLSQVEASRRLELKERTVSNRLAAARKWLAKRLSRRGVELTAVLAATAVAMPQASALPAGLMATTIEAALATATGDRLAGIVSASVAELVRGATTTMIVSKAKMAAVLLLIVATSGSLVGWYGPASGPLAAKPQKPDANTEDNPKASPPKREAVKGLEIQGRVFDPQGKPKAGTELLLRSDGVNGKVTKLGVTAADGRFTVVVPQGKDSESIPALIARADGAGIDFFDISKWKSGKPVELRLVKDRVIRGRIINTEGKPVAGARVTCENIGVFADRSMDYFLTTWKKNYLRGFPDNGVKWLSSPSIRRGGEPLFAARTDAEGRFVLGGIGDERFAWLRLSGDGIAAAELWVINRAGLDPKPYNQTMRDNLPRALEYRATWEKLYGPAPSVIAEAEKVVRGIVKDADSGKGLPNVVVHLGQGGNPLVETPLQAITDAKGRYEIRGAHKAKWYTLEVAEDVKLGYLPSRVYAADTTGYRSVTADITMKKGVILTGKIIDRATGKPLRGIVSAAAMRDNPFVKSFPFLNPSAGLEAHGTGADGVFRAVVPPGPVLLMGRANDRLKFKPVVPDPKYPHYFVEDPEFGVGFYLADGRFAFPEVNFWEVLEIKADAKAVEEDILLERSPAISVHFQDAEGKPLKDVWVAGSTAQVLSPAIQCKEAECPVYQIEPDRPRLMVFYHEQRKLAGTLTLKGDEKAPVVVRLGPAGAIKGRLLDENGRPLTGVVVDVRYSRRGAEEIHDHVYRAKQILSDENGTFALDELIPEQTIELSFHRGKGQFRRIAANTRIQVEPGEHRDLGTIRLKRIPEKDGE